MPNILHSSGGATPGLIKKKLIYQSRTIHYHGEGKHGASSSTVSHIKTTTEYSGRGTWGGGDTWWTCADGPFTFPNGFITIVSITGASYYNLSVSGMIVTIRERIEGINEDEDGDITVVAVGY